MVNTKNTSAGIYCLVLSVCLFLSASWNSVAESMENIPYFSLKELTANPKGWFFYDPITKDNYSKEISVKPQTERLHGTGNGLVFIFRPTIRPTKNGESSDDTCRISPFYGSYNEIKKETGNYTRLTCWVYVEGQRNPLIFLLMYFHDSSGNNLKAYSDMIPVEPGKWEKLELQYDTVPAELKNNLSHIAIGQYYLRPESGDDKVNGTRMYFDDFRLEKHAERQSGGLDADPAVVIVNKIGYSPTDIKTMVVNQNNSALNFTVHDVANRQIVLSGPLSFTSTHYGPVKTGDFSELRKTGKYYIKAGEVKSPIFAIDTEIYWKLANIFRNACFNMRVGCKTDKHDAELLDTAYRVDTGKHVDLSGGYHDAGDLRKYNRNTYRMLLASAIAAKAALNSGSPAEDYLDEAEWAFKHVEKLTNEFGFKDIPARIEYWSDKYCGSRYGQSAGPLRHNNYYTDNIPGTEDDHVVYGGEGVVKEDNAYLLNVVNGLGTLCNTNAIPPKKKEKYLAIAEKLWDVHGTAALRGGNTLMLGPACEAAMAMDRATGEQKWKDIAVQAATKLLANQKTELLSNSNITGYFLRDGSSLESDAFSSYFLDQSAMSALAQMLVSYPTHSDAFKWRAAMLICRDFYLKKLIRLQKPYGLAFYGLKDIKKMMRNESMPSLDVYAGCDKGNNRHFSIGLPDGENDSILTPVRGQSLMWIARALVDLTLQEAARSNLGWQLGENQFNGSPVAELGDDPLRQYYCVDGRNSGVVCTDSLHYFQWGRLIGPRKEAWIAPTLEMMKLSAMLGEKFTLAGKVSGMTGNITIESENFSQYVTLGPDGRFGPLKLDGGCTYKIKAGNVVRNIPAVSGGEADIKFNAEGALSVIPLTVGQEVINRAKEKTGKFTSVHVSDLKPVILKAGSETLFAIQVKRQGKCSGKGELVLESFNIGISETRIPFDLGNEDKISVNVKLLPVVEKAWVISCRLADGNGNGFEITGITK